MKNLKVLIGLMAFIVVAATNINAKPLVHSTTVKDSIHVWTSPELVEIAETWASVYEKLNPEAKINVSITSSDNISNMIEKSGNIGLITKNYLPETNSKSIWKMAVGRDIIVPIMNPKNPLFEEILAKGISPEEFAEAFSSKRNQTWGNLLSIDQSNPVNFYYINNESSKPYLTDFLKTEINIINGKEIKELNELLREIQNDKNSLGFCRLIDLQDFEKHGIEDAISLIPIDINGNDKIDFIENIYNNSNALERSVWIGKYPEVLYSNMYTIAKNKPIESTELAFLEWIITEGQQYLNTDGFSELLVSERQRKVQRLYNNPMPIAATQKPIHKTTSIILIVLITVLLITPIVIMFFRSKNPIIEEEKIISHEVFAESSVAAPNGVFFDKSHTWAFMERDGSVKIGIADFLQHTTGQITNIKTKNAGDSVKKGEPFLTLIQHGKQLNIQSPISGKIKEINQQLSTDSSIINSSPYSEGWIYTIESNNWLNEIKSFFIGETYKTWLKDEFSRLKDFFSSAIKLDVTHQLQTVLQDGGELSDSPMESYGPEVWEEFQIKFINRAR